MANTQRTNLRIYVSDHLALMTGEVELARRVRRENRETPLSAFLSEYLEMLQLQQQDARQLLKTHGWQPSVMKQVSARMVEKLGRFKLNGSLLHYTDLSRVLELEALLLLATARQSMWETLGAARVEGLDADKAEATTADQIATLTEHLKSARQRAMG